MLFEELLNDEKEQGRIQGIEETIKKLYSQELITAKQAAKELNITVEEFLKL